MRRERGSALLILVGVLFSASPLSACSLCTANLRQAPTIRQEAGLDTARLIFLCTLHDPQPGDGVTEGSTKVRITEVLRSDPWLAGRKELVLPRYVNSRDIHLLFCDIYKNELNAYRGVPLRTDAAVEYVHKIFKLDPRDTQRQLLFYADYLEHADGDIARDAFLEFVKASDQEIAVVGRRMSPEKLRGWIARKETPVERIGLYCLLLGACGSQDDARMLERMLGETSERIVKAYDGILGGFLHLRPPEGWRLTRAILADSSRSLDLRMAAARTVSFYHGSQPRETREQVLRCMEAMLVQEELADIAVEDLRRWQLWDLTPGILALYGKKGYESPLMQRAILRYALCCKDERSQAFLAQRRQAEADIVKEVEEGLQYEK